MIFRYRYYISILLFVFGSVAFAQQKVAVQGTVVEHESGEPLVGALVVADGKVGGITNREGIFLLKLVPGQHELVYSFLGYERVSVTINTSQPNLGQVELRLSSTTLDEIVVSATVQNFKNDFKGSNYFIKPQVIKNRNALSTEEILRTVPGVNIIGDMGLSNRPNISIRGSWGRRSKKVLLMEDGSPAAPAPYVAPGAYYNPVSDRVKSIEVYKGADMLRYGPNNMYGGVNYITALPPQKPELRLKLVTGQRNYGTYLASYGGTWNNLGALVEGVYKTFDGFTNNSSVQALNLNAKVFTRLSDDQSLYFKVSGQFEDNLASLSSQTPFTFAADPEQNPFDADQFTMRRYGLDIIHKWLPTENISLVSKIYSSDFERDWWRQITTRVLARDVRAYVGESIYQQRYRYLEQAELGDEDYVLVGKVENGRESTGDSRWTFTVSGLQETMKLAWGEKHELEAGIKFHQENYKDRFVQGANSRWARSGITTTDLKYHLWSASGYIRNEFSIGDWHVTPIMRLEHIEMYRQNLLALINDPDLTSIKQGREYNRYSVLLPGVTVDYNFLSGQLFGSVYKGFIAPSKVFGFLVEQDGVITNPLAGESINIEPELSLNTEIGWRGELFQSAVQGQATYFNNTVHNFYAGGRNEVFKELGVINIQGLELGMSIPLITGEHSLALTGNLTLLRSRVKEGRLEDRDLFSQVIHNQATRDEFISKVNSNREAYELYVDDGNGGDVLFTGQNLTQADFNNLTRSILTLGEEGVKATAPYTPAANLSAGLNYDGKKLSMGVGVHHVASQYAEFNNFQSESADGAIGKLPSYLTMDAYFNYDINVGQSKVINAFLNLKNLTNEIYKASRLNRATSGVFPGGFRQIIMGLNITL